MPHFLMLVIVAGILLDSQLQLVLKCTFASLRIAYSGIRLNLALIIIIHNAAHPSITRFSFVV